MEAKENLIEPLLQKAELYGTTSFELLKLRFLDKSTSVISTLIYRLLLVTLVAFFALILNIAIAIWLGDLLGKYFYGFLAVAAFYGIAAIIFYFMHPFVKARVSNSIITHMLN